jgi:hypothetical protein
LKFDQAVRQKFPLLGHEPRKVVHVQTLPLPELLERGKGFS